MKQLIVDNSKCLGCGTCVALSPKSFKMGDDGKAQVIQPVGDDEESLQNTIDSCPVTAISWKESE